MYPTFSIVINTLNRASLLQKALESFRWLKYEGEFEVIVVNGPSIDDSDKVINAWSQEIRVGKCDVANLSVSRNIGICMARGDIVAFIDDDAIPEPEWLTQLAKPYVDPMVGGVGGLVYDHTGYDFQYKYCAVDRFGNADLSVPCPIPHYSFPKSQKIPHLLGCNSSFRRSALLEIGGFDEEYEYFLDETDVCMRIIDAGYIIQQLSDAYVHHKYAPSNMRSENKVVTNRYPIVKNKVYFMYKHAREFYEGKKIIQEQEDFIQSQNRDIEWAVNEKLLTKEDLVRLKDEMQRAILVGTKRGVEGVRDDAMINKAKTEEYLGEFLNFSSMIKEKSKNIILISRYFPPEHSGGIANFSKDLAEALALAGNIVHLITESVDINRVDFENGIWVHRMLINEVMQTREALKRNIPQHIWDWSATALREAKRIQKHRPIDIVEAPVWDCEGIAFLLNGTFPLITSLHTTLEFYLDSNLHLKGNEEWMETFGNPVLDLERELMTESDGIRANSQAIIKEIEKRYRLKFDVKTVKTIPHGIELSVSQKKGKKNDGKKVTFLFVGRFESRKGVDVLLESISKVLAHNQNVHFRLIGEDVEESSNKKTYRKDFIDKYKEESWFKKISFDGYVDGHTLQEAYVNCDVFVAPSRFESFGLVFLEAMRAGKPVIGCNAGGMPEIIIHEKNGLLVEPGDVEDLSNAILCLASDKSLAKKMGEEGEKLFREKFTSKRMADESLPLYDLANLNHRENLN